MRRRRDLRRGAVLLEVVVGMTILTIAATAWIALLNQTTHSVHTLHQREEQMRAASAELRRIALWPRVELDARIGSSRLPSFRIDVAQLATSLYAVTLRDTVTNAVVLATAIYAPENAKAAR